MLDFHFPDHKFGKWEYRQALDSEGTSRGRHKWFLIVLWPINFTLFLEKKMISIL
jgi:hypothetical protein